MVIVLKPRGSYLIGRFYRNRSVHLKLTNRDQAHQILGSDHLIFMGGGGGAGRFFEKKIIRTVIRTNKIDRMTKQTKKNIQDGVKKDGQENVKRQMGTN